MICIGGVPVLKRHFGGAALKYFTWFIGAGGSAFVACLDIIDMCDRSHVTHINDVQTCECIRISTMWMRPIAHMNTQKSPISVPKSPVYTHSKEPYIYSEWMNATNRTYERVKSHIWRHTQARESCRTYEWVMSHIWTSHVAHMKTHTGTWVMAVSPSLLNEHECVAVCFSVLQCVAVCCSVLQCRQWVRHSWMSHVAHTNEPCLTHGCVSHMNELCHTYGCECGTHKSECVTHKWVICVSLLLMNE